MTPNRWTDKEELMLFVAVCCVGTFLLNVAFTIAWGWGR